MLKEALLQLSHTFDTHTLVHGKQIQQQGGVLNARLSEGLLHARVRDDSRIVDVYCDLRKWPKQKADCHCKEQKHCAHLAASLFALQEKSHLSLPEDVVEKMDAIFTQWLENLQKEEAKKKLEREYVVTYQLSFFEKEEAYVHVSLGLSRLTKSGDLGKPKPMNYLTERNKAWCHPVDEEIIAALLFVNERGGYLSDIAFRDSTLLEKIITTGRAYVHEHYYILSLGQPLEGSCEWQLTPLGEEILVLCVNHQVLESVLYLSKPWVYDEEKHQLSLINVPYNEQKLKVLLDAPPVPIERAAAYRDKLSEQFLDLPKPIVYEDVVHENVTPIAGLAFAKVAFDIRDKWNYWDWDEDEDDDIQNEHCYVIYPYYQYAELRISPHFPKPIIWQKKAEQLIAIQRDMVFEEQKFQELQSILKIRTAEMRECEDAVSDISLAWILEDVHHDEDIQALHAHAIPLLKSQGWQIEYQDPSFQEVLIGEDLEWFADVSEGNQFFSYALGIVIDGQSVSVVPLVAKLLRDYRDEALAKLADETRLELHLPDGRKLDVAAGRIKPLVQLLLQLGVSNIEEERLTLNRYQMLLLAEAEEAMKASLKRWVSSANLQNKLKSFITNQNIPEVSLPTGLQTELRAYQHLGLNWLQWLREVDLGGVLADDMGLGKTVQTLAHLLCEQEQGRIQKASLIVAPTSLVGNWRNEAFKFAPSLRVLVYHGAQRHEGDFDDYDLIVTTYGLLQRDKKRFLEYQFYYLILDEAQCIKNARTKTTLIAQQLNAKHRLCLTGTPLENHLEELWSLFHFLMPGFLGDIKTFRSFFRNPIEKDHDKTRQLLLAKRVQPFLLRRSKVEVAKELPPKTEIIRTIVLEGPQRDLYEAIRMSMEKKVREAIVKQGLGRSHIVLLDALLKMRQVCCDPRLVKLDLAAKAHQHSAKLDMLMDLLDGLMEEGRRVLIFSQFTSMLELIEKALNAKQYTYLKLTGQTIQRQALVDKFQQGDASIFLISLKAGGTGLNLTRADTVIHYDPWWNPAAEDQATDRAHRIGQDNPVFVYKLIAEGTVEEAMLRLQEKKRDLYSGVFNGVSQEAGVLSEADLSDLFKPIG